MGTARAQSYLRNNKIFYVYDSNYMHINFQMLKILFYFIKTHRRRYIDVGRFFFHNNLKEKNYV